MNGHDASHDDTPVTTPLDDDEAEVSNEKEVHEFVG